ncbi:16S rRNA (cytidine(1402)-2'-O)-methyltransferase [Candidatus Shapirobacteria bacterium]|nr:16S rRNA (cytidine(1402)-2'-O)-methyltransferase [Candidatus Shapirobacteria bacterium]
MDMVGQLFIVATPIGNLKDITQRAIEILSSIELIACEDTRKTGLLLQKLEIKNKPKLLSYYEENEQGRIPQIINLLKQGKNVALVSNAGTPTISDPGYKLVKECLQQGIKVESIPGPSSVLTALTSSGLPTDKFLFLGFLPKKEGKRKTILKTLPKKTTIIFFESPFRLLKTLKELKEIWGDIEIVICRELTKVFEEIRREKISSSIDYFEKNKIKGELTLCFNIPLESKYRRSVSLTL